MNTESTSAARLHASGRAVDDVAARFKAINQRMQELDAAAQRRRDQAEIVNAPRRQKRSLLEVILRRGGAPDSEEQERLNAIDNEIAAAQATAAGVADELQVIADLQVELQREAEQLHATHRPLLIELAETQFAAAREEIEREALPEFFAAAETFRQAYGKICGLGKAHCALAERVAARFNIHPGNSIGAPWPSEQRLALVGFPIEDALRGHPTLVGSHASMLTLRAGDLIDEVAASALQRWETMK